MKVYVRILPYFQEEMIVQENPNKLEKKIIAWREEKKQIKESYSIYSQLTRLLVDYTRVLID